MHFYTLFCEAYHNSAVLCVFDIRNWQSCVLWHFYLHKADRPSSSSTCYQRETQLAKINDTRVICIKQFHDKSVNSEVLQEFQIGCLHGSSSLHLLKQLHWLPVEWRIKSKMLGNWPII